MSGFSIFPLTLEKCVHHNEEGDKRPFLSETTELSQLSSVFVFSFWHQYLNIRVHTNKKTCYCCLKHCINIVCNDISKKILFVLIDLYSTYINYPTRWGVETPCLHRLLLYLPEGVACRGAARTDLWPKPAIWPQDGCPSKGHMVQEWKLLLSFGFLWCIFVESIFASWSCHLCLIFCINAQGGRERESMEGGGEDYL